MATRDGDAAPTAWLPYVLATGTVLFFAGHTTLGRAIRYDIPPIALVFWRALVALAIITPFVFPTLRRQFSRLASAWRVVVALAISQVVFGQCFLYVGLQTATATTAGLLHASIPIVSTLVAWIWLRQAPTRLQSIGIAVALVGLITIVVRGSLQTLRELDFVKGDFIVEIAFISWGVYSVVVSQVSKDINPLVVFWGMTLASLMFVAPLYAAEIVFTDARVALDLVTVLTVAYCAIFASILALIFLNIAVARIGPVRAGAPFFLMPVFTTLLGVIVLGESLHLYHLFGMVLVASGVWLTSRRHNQPRGRDGET
ncbi:MAG: DMT family transporter [Alphaproteobacteria bacterium]|nr:DMT family transporter [Alphaproteobacteria bacterium]